MFLPRVHLQKQQQKQGENLQGFIHDSGFSETLQYISSWINIVVLLNVSLNYIISLSWLFVKISFLSLFRLSFSVVHEHRMQENSKCRVYQMNMELRSKSEKRRHATCRLFSRGVIFTRARVLLALLSLRKNGGLLVVYLATSVHSNTRKFALEVWTQLGKFRSG